MARGTRGRQQAIGVDLRPDRAKTRVARRREFGKVIALYIQRRFFVGAAIDVGAFIGDVNEKIARRGFVLWNGQLLTTPVEDIEPGTGLVPLEGERVKGHNFQLWIKVGRDSEIIHERNSGDPPYEVPVRREWSQFQKEFFHLENPYQMAEDAADYTWSHLMARVVEPYIFADERIAGIIHGEKDNYYFYCPCHCAEVVYTTRQRLVCMGCGATHAVLREPVALKPARLLTAEEWLDYFDDEGSRRDDEIELSVVDFRDVENAETIWTTEQWEDAKHRFIFFARSPPEVVAEAIRGTEADPSIFLEAGWSPMETSLPPAHQVVDDGIDVDLLENAAHAFREGVFSFLRGRNEPERLVTAIPQLFRAVELLLKARLVEIQPNALDDQPNNPTVLDRLDVCGVAIKKEERQSIDRLRVLRNDLQHGSAKFSHRTGLAMSRRAVVFFDRFSRDELHYWIGDVIPPNDRYELLSIPEICEPARELVASRLEEMRAQPQATISGCQRCGEQTMVRPHPRTGASCLLCGYVHVQKEDDEGAVRE